ncbi:hypothetical protein E1J38_000570 [Seonamhaeicola sediminis]|uniref:Nucleotide-diphospho-sugar transferase domain-containing protein n=1 Tax=Seonamhaeicola sediminis TaxID=2528206 RepID=A0A562YH83_9FLAO|nr:hypothetical protein [Seonamhaeicola sediminis]TWO34375.1 hypothetical protein E1J38_000570 [Seonamhaeicola sediminis]
MKVCIISGRYPQTKFSSAINHKIYADKFGYSYIHCNYPTQAKNPYLNKIHYVLSFIDYFDYLVWIDDDAFFFDFEKDIMSFMPKGDKFLSFCKSPSFKELKTYLSSGQFIIKNNSLSKQFLRDILNISLNDIKAWWKKDLGYFSNGDQDAIIYLLLTKEAYKEKYILYNYKAFNSRAENLFNKDVHKPLILHFTGKPNIKKSNYLKVQKLLGLPPSLVLKKYANAYKLTKEDRLIPSFKNYLKRIVKWFSS